MGKPKGVTSHDAINAAGENILLVNPPVIDSRYPWIKWNQPLDLLKLATKFSQESSCDLKLFDFLIPSVRGRVPRLKSPIPDVDNDVTPTRFWFGKSLIDFERYLTRLEKNNWYPDSIWVTTLTSFWWETVPIIGNIMKNTFSEAQITLIGNYPVFENDHALANCLNIDVIVIDKVDLKKYPAMMSIYADEKPHFSALDIRSPDPLEEIHNSIGMGISHFVFFNENIFTEFDSLLKPILEQVIHQNLDIRFHAICGLETRDFPINDVKLFADAKFADLHFEPIMNIDGTIDEYMFTKVLDACEKVGLASKKSDRWQSSISVNISGFFWIGRPNEDIETLVWNSLKLNHLLGMAIPKPFSPTPSSKEYEILVSIVGKLQPDEISPHRIPFAIINEIDKDDYLDLYRLTALLNYKIRSSTFDFLKSSHLVRTIKDSFKERRWDL